MHQGKKEKKEGGRLAAAEMVETRLWFRISGSRLETRALEVLLWALEQIRAF